MFVTRCPLCDRVNPEHSKFCNECGVSLLRVGVCARCGALNELSASACHQCAAVLVERGSRSPTQGFAAESPADHETPAGGPESQPAAEPDSVSQHHRSPRRRRGLSTVQRAVIAGTALGAVVGAFGYFTYSQSSVVDVSGLLPATPNEVRVAGGPSNARAAMLSADDVVTPRTTQPLPHAAAPLAADDPPPPPRLASGTSSSTKSIDMPAQIVGPCTAAVAALGLCTFEPAQPKE